MFNYALAFLPEKDEKGRPYWESPADEQRFLRFMGLAYDCANARSPPVAKSGAEAERQRQRANSDRSVEHKVMGSARMVQPDNLSSGFFWGDASGKRAW